MVTLSKEMAISEFIRWAKSWHLDIGIDLDTFDGSQKTQNKKIVDDLIRAIEIGRLIVSQNENGKIEIEHALLSPIGQEGTVKKLTYSEPTVAHAKNIDKFEGKNISAQQSLMASMAKVNMVLLNDLVAKDFNLFGKIVTLFLFG